MKSKRIEEHFSNTKQHKKIEEKNKKLIKSLLKRKNSLRLVTHP